tara:strand:- start:412 stop:897 length:486 start_codon:yes stop_codon:yes gene_type:complete
MSEDDFCEVRDDDERLDEIARAALSALPVQKHDADTVERVAAILDSMRDCCGLDQDGNSYIDEETHLFAVNALGEAAIAIRSLPTTPPQEVSVQEAVALLNAVDALDFRRLVAGWNGENREGDWEPHPEKLGVTLKTNAGLVYAIDQATEALRALSEKPHG